MSINTVARKKIDTRISVLWKFSLMLSLDFDLALNILKTQIIQLLINEDGGTNRYILS
jgi:hypothetical protein